MRSIFKPTTIEVCMKTNAIEDRREFVFEADDLPLIIKYKDRKYVLVLTKSDKIILNKAIE